MIRSSFLSSIFLCSERRGYPLIQLLPVCSLQPPTDVTIGDEYWIVSNIPTWTLSSAIIVDLCSNPIFRTKQRCDQDGTIITEHSDPHLATEPLLYSQVSIRTIPRYGEAPVLTISIKWTNELHVDNLSPPQVLCLLLPTIEPDVHTSK